MFVRTTIVFIVATLLVACAAPVTPTPTPMPTPTLAPLVPLRIGVLPVTDVVPFYVAEQQGHFAKQGVKVEFVPVASAAERDQMMAAEQLDGQLNELTSTVLFNAKTPRLKVVRIARAAFPNAPLFWLLVPKESTIKSVQDLKGKEIALSQNTVIDYITQRILERGGLAFSDVKTTNVPAIPTRLQLLQQNQIAAATLPDPFASLALLQGARVLVDDTTCAEYSLSVITFRTDVLTKRASDVKKFLAAYDQAIADIRATPDKFRNILIERGRVPDQLKDKYQFPPFPDPSVPTRAQWDDVVKWALERKLITAPVTYESSVDAGFVK